MPELKRLAEAGTRRLYHRGPDGQRWWISDDGRVGLGHARLSIIDLATGDQPIANEEMMQLVSMAVLHERFSMA